MAKGKVKVLVKIYIVDDVGEEVDILRQFTVTDKRSYEEDLALKISEHVEKKFDVSNMEAWSI